jgi:FtsP/CotA-like multicopper oxidase with cupredoxin domain
MRRRGFLLALAAAPLVARAAEPPGKAFELAIVKGRVDGARETLRVRKGDKVELRWTSDRRIALHLHGYDIETTVTPGTPAAMSFQASIAGRFPVSEHGHGSRHERALLYLEVLP